MGLDYSYKLFFPRSQLWAAVGAAAALARPHPDEQTIIEFPDRELILPFGQFPEKKSRIPFDDSMHRRRFSMSLYFEFDEMIKQYADEWRREVREIDGFEEWELPLDAQGRVVIGCIYLTIYRDLNIYSRKDYDPNLVMLDFTAATTGMSLLFERSASVRDTFTLLLMLNRGDYGLLDRENDAVIIWWKGQALSKVIADSWLSQREIESILASQKAAL